MEEFSRKPLAKRMVPERLLPLSKKTDNEYTIALKLHIVSVVLFEMPIYPKWYSIYGSILNI